MLSGGHRAPRSSLLVSHTDEPLCWEPLSPVTRAEALDVSHWLQAAWTLCHSWPCHRMPCSSRGRGMDLPWERKNRLQFSLITGYSQVERTAEKRDGGRVLLTNQAWSTCCHIARWSIWYLPLLQGSDVICRSFCSIPAWLGADGGTLLLPAVRKANRLGWGMETPIPVSSLSGRRVTRILPLPKRSLL